MAYRQNPFDPDEFELVDDEFEPVGDDEFTAVDDEEDSSGGNRWGDWVGAGIRGLSGWAANAPAVGALIGGGGDLAAQAVERLGGSRKRFNLLQTGGAAALGAIPFGKAGKTIWQFGKGALFGAGGAAADDAADQALAIANKEQEGYDVGRTLKAAEFGGVLGTAGAGVGELASKFLSKRKAFGPQLETIRETAERVNPFRRADEAHMPAAGRPALEPTAGADPGNPLPVSETDFGPFNPTPRTRRSQIEGIDPASFPRGRQQPQTRGGGIVRNNADIAGELDPPLGPTNQGPSSLPGSSSRGPSFLRKPPTRQLPAMTEGGGEAWDIPGGTHPQSPDAQTSLDFKFDEDPMVAFERGQHRKTLDAMQDLTDMLGRKGKYAPTPDAPELTIREDGPTTLNASGESSASMEAISRGRGMQDRGEQFVAYDKAGNRKVVGTGVDSVDYVAREGETFGIEKADGSFQKLDDRGGRVPTTEHTATDTPQTRGDLYTSSKASGRMYIPAELMALHRDLGPEWAAKAGNPEDLLPFSKRILSAAADDPTSALRKLMNRERKAVRSARDRGKAGAPGTEGGDRHSLLGQADSGAFPAKADVSEDQSITDMISKLFGDEGGGGMTRLIDDESGSIDPELARRLGYHGGSAAASSLAAGALSDDENRTRNMIGAGIVGGAAPLAFTKPDALRKFRYFSMLGSTGAQAKNLVGNAGAVAVRAAEEAMTGNTQGAKQILSEVFSPQTANKVVEAFKNAPEAETRWGKNSGVLGTFSRIMHAVDEAATEGLERGGLTNDEARLSLHTSEPRSKWGKYIASRPEGAMDIFMPFVRTGTNLVERGLEHTPGVGMLPAVRGMRDASNKQVAARQALGALAVLLGATAGSDDPYVGAALGPLAIPFTAGAAGRTAIERRGDDFSNLIRAEMDVLKNALPLPTDAYDYDPGKLLASFVPGVLRDASQVKTSSLDTSGSVFNPAIAKVPFLNERLLKRKRKRSREKNK